MDAASLSRGAQANLAAGVTPLEKKSAIAPREGKIDPSAAAGEESPLGCLLFQKHSLGHRKCCFSVATSQETTTMSKKVLYYGVLYFLLAILFAIGAIGKTISDNSTVLAMQWFCAFIFALMGVMQLRKKTAE